MDLKSVNEYFQYILNIIITGVVLKKNYISMTNSNCALFQLVINYKKT